MVHWIIHTNEEGELDILCQTESLREAEKIALEYTTQNNQKPCCIIANDGGYMSLHGKVVQYDEGTMH